jgi:diguanylate cyclase (GGDEF)-like protein
MGVAISRSLGLWHEPGLDGALGMAVALAHVVDAMHSAEDLVPALTDAASIAARGGAQHRLEHVFQRCFGAACGGRHRGLARKRCAASRPRSRPGVAIRLHGDDALHLESGARQALPAAREPSAPDELQRLDRGHDLAVCVALREPGGAPLGVLLAAEHGGPPGGDAEILQALRLFADSAVAAVLAAGAHREAERLAGTDGLTGLGNRRAFMERVTPLLEARSEHGVGLLLRDMDGLKEINDRDGHEAGDVRLRALAAAMRSAGAGEGAAFRLGGDEFALLIETGGDRRVGALARALGQALEAVGISASIGRAVGRGDCTVDALIEAADAEMYRVKRHRARPARRPSAAARPAP